MKTMNKFVEEIICGSLCLLQLNTIQNHFVHHPVTRKEVYKNVVIKILVRLIKLVKLKMLLG